MSYDYDGNLNGGSGSHAPGPGSPYDGNLNAPIGAPPSSLHLPTQTERQWQQLVQTAHSRQTFDYTNPDPWSPQRAGYAGGAFPVGHIDSGPVHSPQPVVYRPLTQEELRWRREQARRRHERREAKRRRWAHVPFLLRAWPYLALTFGLAFLLMQGLWLAIPLSVALVLGYAVAEAVARGVYDAARYLIRIASSSVHRDDTMS